TPTGLLSLDATLTNISTAPLSAPLKVRVVGLRTGSGSATIANSDNRHPGTGAVWDFSGLVERGVLKPGEKTHAKRFEFRLKDIQPFRPNQYSKIVPELIDLETKVLGTLLGQNKAR